MALPSDLVQQGLSRAGARAMGNPPMCITTAHVDFALGVLDLALERVAG